MEDLSKFDLMQLVRRAIELHNPKEALQLDNLTEYITISTEGGSLTDLGVDLDVNKVSFSAETSTEVTFTDKDLVPYTHKASEFGKTWIVLNQRGILGSLLTKAYDDLILAIKNQVPHELKNKVK
jgi:hypothetical protein